MSCSNPVLAVSIMKNNEDKHVLKFIPRSEIENLTDLKRVYGSDEVFLLPCMKCKSCREDYAKDWAIRCSLEAKTHKFNYFVTLTYDEFHILRGGKHDFTRFLKSLGYELTGKPERPRFFACMERGSLTDRLHFHCVLFLDSPLDLKRPVKIGTFYHFSCDLLDKCWSCGFVDVAPFANDCAAYVAKYSTKQGSCFMSRNLAKPYYEVHKFEIVKDDFKVYGSFGLKNVVDIPKCFVRWFIEDDINEIDGFKLTKKKLQRLYMMSLIHEGHYTKESDVLRDKILIYLKHNQYKKERSDL